MGWMRTAPESSVQYAKEYLNLTEEEGYNWGMMRGALSSVAEMAIVTMQDLIGLGSEARLNAPATMGNNWKWRATEDQITEELARKLYKYTDMYGRVNK
jgi:4-alpha-glucanotransferase